MGTTARKFRRQRSALLVWGFVVLAVPLVAQDEIVPTHPLSSWLEAGAELRVRSEMESFEFPGQEQESSGVFSRARLGFKAAPAPWLHLAVQFQDSRTLTGPAGIVREFQDNHVDAQYAYVDVGSEKEGRWRVRAGRQALAFGDERLVGADSSWDNRAQRFDGVRATVKWRNWRWDAFSATPTTVLPNRLDRFTSPERFSGLYGAWSHKNTVIEPYVLWRRVPDEHSSFFTPGARIASPVALHMDVVAEVAMQRGSATGSPVGAWAAYMETGYRLGGTDKSPRLSASYSYAAGDSNLRDHRVGTFNDLHPAGYNGCGFFEPFAWRNIRDLRAGAEWTGPGHWRMKTDVHGYWLATVADGVYVDEGPFIAYNPLAQSARLGSRLLFMAQHSLGSHSDAAFGYAKFWAADYLKAGMSLSHSAFVSWSVRL